MSTTNRPVEESDPVPDFPHKVVDEILTRFGIDHAEDLEPWPHPDESDDLLAGFTFRDQWFFLKRRWIEQRGERSLFETQYVLKQLLKQGFPAATLWSSPDGETLIKGPDWEEEREVYYEIQHRIFGSHFQLTAETAHDAGAFVARFHRAGDRIDTFLLGKAYWTQTFIQRRFGGFEVLLERLSDRDDLDENDLREIQARFDRHCSIVWRKELTWGLAHGDLCANNLLISNGDFCLIDFEEIGRTEIAGEAANLMLDLPAFDETIMTELLRGYRSSGGNLNHADLTSIVDVRILGALNRALDEPAGEIDIPFLLDRFRFILDC